MTNWDNVYEVLGFSTFIAIAIIYSIIFFSLYRATFDGKIDYKPLRWFISAVLALLSGVGLTWLLKFVIVGVAGFVVGLFG